MNPATLAVVGHEWTDRLGTDSFWRAGDPVKHVGPPEGLVPMFSPLWQTRCGLEAKDGAWTPTTRSQNDDVWCVGCIKQAGIPFVEEEW